MNHLLGGIKFLARAISPWLSMIARSDQRRIPTNFIPNDEPNVINMSQGVLFSFTFLSSRCTSDKVVCRLCHKYLGRQEI